MELGLRGKKALVTGASKGIGRACAEVLAEEGCDIALVSRTAADLEAARAAITGKHNVAVRVFPLDRLKELAVERTIGSVAATHYSFMGATDPVQMVDGAREVAGKLKADGVDAVLLTSV